MNMNERFLFEKNDDKLNETNITSRNKIALVKLEDDSLLSIRSYSK